MPKAQPVEMELVKYLKANPVRHGPKCRVCTLLTPDFRKALRAAYAAQNPPVSVRALAGFIASKHPELVGERAITHCSLKHHIEQGHA